MVILIPARGGSKRIPGKALKLLGGKPLIWWTVNSCARVGALTVCTDSAEIGEASGCNYWLRPSHTASDDAPDISWLRLALEKWPDEDVFMIRRPTSPFISIDTVMRAKDDFLSDPDATAMRAMRPVTEHLNKMWERRGVWMKPASKSAAYSKGLLEVEPWSMPTQQLATVYVQTAGLEIIRRSTLESGSLTGDRLLPLFLEGPEALDINTPDDWARAEEIAKTWTPS